MLNLDDLQLLKQNLGGPGVDTDILNCSDIQQTKALFQVMPPYAEIPAPLTIGTYGVAFLSTFGQGYTPIPLGSLTLSSLSPITVTFAFTWPTSGPTSENFGLVFGNAVRGGLQTYSRPTTGATSLTLTFTPDSGDLGVVRALSLVVGLFASPPTRLTLRGRDATMTVVQNGTTLYSGTSATFNDTPMPAVRVFVSDLSPKVVTLQFDSLGNVQYVAPVPVFVTVDGQRRVGTLISKRVYKRSTISARAIWLPRSSDTGKIVTVSFEILRSVLEGTNAVLEVS